MESLQRLQFDIGEQISRKEYLRRKKKNSQNVKKRSKITYILMATFMALAIYIIAQVFEYRRYNSFKYTLGDGVNSQAVYNIYFVTEGYTYDPVYSISSISSLGEDEKTILPSSNIDDIVVEKDYIYGIRDGAICQITKDKYEITELFNDNVKKFVKRNNMIFYTSTSDGVLKAYNVESKKTRTYDISDVEQILVNDSYVFPIVHNTEEKSIYRFEYNGNGKKKISGDEKVSYAIESDGIIYFVNKGDNNHICSIDTNGDWYTVLEDTVGVSTTGPAKMVNGSKYMFVKDNKLYYVNKADEETLWSYDTKTKEKEKVISASIEILQNVDNTIFYKIDKEMGVYLYNYETKFMSLITKRRVKEFVIDTYTDIFKDND